MGGHRKHDVYIEVADVIHSPMGKKALATATCLDCGGTGRKDAPKGQIGATMDGKLTCRTCDGYGKVDPALVRRD
jgi:DnaJ-class molecular chaperone